MWKGLCFEGLRGYLKPSISKHSSFVNSLTTGLFTLGPGASIFIWPLPWRPSECSLPR